jgi:hypothetical protein
MSQILSHFFVGLSLESIAHDMMKIKQVLYGASKMTML